MSDLAAPERPDGRHAAVHASEGVPPMPVVRPAERYVGFPYPLLDGVSPTIGWQWRPEDKGGPVFLIIRRGALGGSKAVESFPLTADGWVSAWQVLVAQNPAIAPKVLAVLRARAVDVARSSADSREITDLNARSIASLREVAYLGGYAPEAEIFAGERYDVRFLEDCLVIVPCHQAEILSEVPYGEVEDVEIGGPGLVKTGGGFVGGGFGARGAIEGMAIAAVLNALTTRTSIKTIVRIQGTDCEFFLLHTKVTPEQLRIELSRALGAIRSARAREVPSGGRQQAPVTSASPVGELTKLAGMLENGLLTRDEFDQLKARLLAGS